MVDRISSYGGLNKASALRSSRSPPRNASRGPIDGQKSSLSPLRSAVGRQYGGVPQGLAQSQKRDTQEEAMYERRRQQELRRQIQQKEHELETLSQNKERLKQHLHSTGKPMPEMVNSYNQRSNSPLRDKVPSPKRNNFVPNFGSMNTRRANGVEETDSKFRDRTPPTRLHPHDVPTKQKSPASPLRNKSGSPTRQYNLGASIDPNRVSTQEYLNQLVNDNESLQRRLNLVLQELDRVNRDRGNLIQQYNMTEKDVQNMQRLIDSEDATDKMNNNLQVDVMGHRDNNENFKHRITETDQTRTDAIGRLRVLQAERDRKSSILDEIREDLNTKLHLLKELEEQQMMAHDRVQTITAEIDRLQRNCMQDEAQNHDIQMIIDRLTQERNDLLQKLDQLNRTYDNCVQEITRERGQMDQHNKHHNKLLIAKVMFQLMEKMFAQRKQDSLNEFFTYCRFDEKCHGTLKQFVQVVQRLGEYKMKIALKQWHQKTFKPIEMLEQNQMAVVRLHRNKILTKYFNAWTNARQHAGDLYGAKNKALLAIWNAKCADVKKDVLRAFTIWRDSTNYEKLKRQRMKRLVWRCYNNRLAQAWVVWNSYSSTLNSQVRLHILAMEFAEKQLKQAVFGQIRLATAAMKRKRQNMLRTYVKAWREHNTYRRYMMHQNMTVLNFKKTSNTWLLKRCFDVLRQNKEEEKLFLMETALEGDCQPAIEEMNKQIERKTKQAVQSGKKRGLTAASKNLKAYLSSYFQHWKNLHQAKEVAINKDLRAMIIRRFHQRQQQAFDMWKKGGAKKAIQFQEMTIMGMEEEGAQMQAEVEALDVEIKKKENQVVRSGRSANIRAVKICHRRYLKQAMDRWRESKNSKNNAEDKSDLIIKKTRKKFLRQAFDLYKEGVLYRKRGIKNEKSVDQLIKTHQARNLRKIFNAWCAYKYKFQKAKSYWNIVFTNMDTWMKKRAFMNWKNQGNIKMSQMMIEETNNLTEQMVELEHKRGGLTKKVADKSSKRGQMQKRLVKQGSMLVMNAFQRAYGGSTAQAWMKWKEYCRATKHQEDTVRKTLNHWKHYNTYLLMSCMKLWSHKVGIENKEEELKNINKEIEENGRQIEHGTTTYAEDKSNLESHIGDVMAKHNRNLGRHEKMMAQITWQNHNHHYQSRLRYIFTQWAAYTKRQRHFADTIKNIVQKSIWQKGMDHIRAFSNDKKLTRDQNKSLEKIRRMFWRRNCGAAMSKWRQTEYIQTMEMIAETHQQEGMDEEVFERKVEKIEEFNFDRSSRIIKKREKHKYWYAWKRVIKWMKHKRVSQQHLAESMGSYGVKRALKKWRARTETTIAARGAYEKFHDKNNHNLKYAVWIRLLNKYQREKALVMKCHQLAKKFDNRGLLSGFQMIQNFVRSKNDVHRHEKGLSAKNMNAVLTRLHRKRLLDYMSHMRLVSLKWKREHLKKLTMVKHCLSRSLRHAFDSWKRQANIAQTVLEVNDAGPVVEEVLEHQLDVHNLKKLMQDEGFKPSEIDDIEHEADKKSLEKMAKVVGRWKHYTYEDDKYLIPKMFDRWRQWIQLRKIVKHWMDFIANKQNYSKADLQHAFGKWKFMKSDEQNVLQTKTRDQLAKRAVLAQKRLQLLAESTGNDEDMINHLSDQNEELFENFKKGRKLALVLWRDNRQTQLRKGFSAFLAQCRASTSNQLNAELENDIGIIAALKDKIAEVEKDNDSLANENEELRQFSLDGYQLGKNVQNLQAERENLSVDLADKASTIKKLLDENEKLSQQLRNAQEKAAGLIRSSQNSMAPAGRASMVSAAGLGGNRFSP